MRIIISTIAALIFLSACSDINNTTWPDGRIPYVMIGFTGEEMAEIWRAMLTWESVSGDKIKFINLSYADKNDDTRTLFIYKNNFSKDSIAFGLGYFSNKQNVMFIGEPQKQRSILHELGHVIGLHHEHQRPDRDLYITIHWSLISGLFAATQFTYDESPFYNYRKYPYDFQSIMHYRKSECPAIDSHGHEIGNDTISIIDALKVRDMYNEPM
jgi:hypothetical protein